MSSDEESESADDWCEQWDTILDDIAQVYSQSSKTPTPGQVSLALLEACDASSWIDQRYAVNAVCHVFDQLRRDTTPPFLASWIDVACKLSEWYADDEILRKVVHFATQGVLHADMVKPLVRCVELSIEMRDASEALVKLAEQGVSHEDMGVAAVDLVAHKQKQWHAVGLRLLLALPTCLKCSAALQLVSKLAKKKRSPDSLATVVGILVANDVRTFDTSVLKEISRAAASCAAARDVCAELISAGCATSMFLNGLTCNRYGHRVLFKCAGDVRFGSGVLLAPLKELRPDEDTISIAMRLMINEHCQCALLQSVHEKMMLPTPVWLQIVDYVGLFHSALAPRAAVDASEFPGCSTQHRSWTAAVKSNVAHVQAPEQEHDADSHIERPQIAEEEAALISPEEAAAVVEEQWASAVELRIVASNSTRDGSGFSASRPSTTTATDSHSQAMVHVNGQSSSFIEAAPLPEAGAGPEAIYILQYNKHPRSFMNALLNGRALQECRQALEHEGHSCELPSGCKVFVHPHQFRLVMDALNGRDLRPHHVVVADSLQHLVEESLAQLPYKQRPRVKSASRLEASSADLSEDIVDSTMEQPLAFSEDFDVIRTLLIHLPILPLPLRRPESVVQSAPAGDSSMNPRQAAHLDRIDAIVPDG